MSRASCAFANVYNASAVKFLLMFGNLQHDFVTKQGLRQGEIQSPALFNIICDDVIKEIKEKESADGGEHSVSNNKEMRLMKK